MVNAQSAVMVHIFEERGLGRAPYAYLGEQDGGSIGAGHSCDYCGTAIRYLHLLKSADGRTFQVGCDCIAKSGDRGLISKAKLAEKERREERRREQFRTEQQARNAAREAQLAQERERNGGLTDEEVRQAAIQAERKVRAEILKPIADALAWSSSDFAASVRRGLESGNTPEGRGEAIMLEIASKNFGRKGSNAYNEAYDRFCDVLDEYETHIKAVRA